MIQRDTSSSVVNQRTGYAKCIHFSESLLRSGTASIFLASSSHIIQHQEIGKKKAKRKKERLFLLPHTMQVSSPLDMAQVETT